MENFSFLNYLFGAGLAALGWFSREMWSMVKSLKDEITILKDHINEHYVRKDDFRDFKTELFAALSRIEGKLDGKQDK